MARKILSLRNEDDANWLRRNRMEQQLGRARGCLLGQLAGDALGELVEFQSPETIKGKYPEGVREIVDGGTWDTLAGQPTDDSELALALARSIVARNAYDAKDALKEYKAWLASAPFDCGGTIYNSLCGEYDSSSQANGAMMRISPVGIFGAKHDLAQVAEWARQDAALTHPNLVCVQANDLFAVAIATAVKTETEPEELYKSIVARAKQMKAEPSLLAAVESAADSPPPEYVKQAGWVLVALQNALWQLLHARSLECGVVDTVGRGGDADTNAAICGALLGAVHGEEAIPHQWRDCVLNCQPKAGIPGVKHPRPECYWPVDALELAEKLLG